MNNNYLTKTLLLLGIVIGCLLLLSLLPDIEIKEGTYLTKPDLFSDLKEKTHSSDEGSEGNATDSMGSTAQSKKPVPKGIIPIEDYSAAAPRQMMEKFYARLDSVKSAPLREKTGEPRPVRIAYYGDSFICCDVLTSHLREMLQDDFGGCGIGAFDVAMPDNKSTMIMKTNSLDYHVATKRQGFKPEQQGLTSAYSIAGDDAWIKVSGTSTYNAHVGKWNVSRIYFRPSKPTTINCSINEGTPKTAYSGMSKALQKAEVKGDIKHLTWEIKGKGSTFYIAANEDTTGVSVDNFGLVAAQGKQLKSIPQTTLNEFARLRAYDLIIFQYGLNVASPKEDSSYPRFRK